MISMTNEEILKTEFDEEFVQKMRNRMIVSYHKYGAVAINAGKKLVDEMESLQMRINRYMATGNTEFLVDVANFAMIEYMYPSIKDACFTGTDSDKSPGLAGTCVNEMKGCKP